MLRRAHWYKHIHLYCLWRGSTNVKWTPEMPGCLQPEAVSVTSFDFPDIQEQSQNAATWSTARRHRTVEDTTALASRRSVRTRRADTFRRGFQAFALLPHDNGIFFLHECGAFLTSQRYESCWNCKVRGRYLVAFANFDFRNFWPNFLTRCAKFVWLTLEVENSYLELFQAWWLIGKEKNSRKLWYNSYNFWWGVSWWDLQTSLWLTPGDP